MARQAHASECYHNSNQVELAFVISRSLGLISQRSAPAIRNRTLLRCTKQVLVRSCLRFGLLLHNWLCLHRRKLLERASWLIIAGSRSTLTHKVAIGKSL